MTGYVVNFSALETAADVAAAIGCSEDLLLEVAQSHDQASYYLEHAIPKRNPRSPDRKRMVLEPSTELKAAQKALARRLGEFAEKCVKGYPGLAAHGFVRGRGTRTNASVHVGAPILVRADISGFFRAISTRKVQTTLERMGLQQVPAELIAKFVTVDGSLREGSPTSPLIANLYAIPMDEEMLALAQCFRKCHYTRYADDIAFSGKKRVPTKAEIETIVTRHGFTLSPGKYRRTKPGQSHYVTGLSISAPPDPRAPRKLKRRVRQELYYADKHGIVDHAFRRYSGNIQHAVNTIDGHISYIISVERRAGILLRRNWEAVIQRDRVRPRHAAARQPETQDLYFFVDETFLDEAQQLMAVGLVVLDHDSTTKLRERAQTLHSEHLGDPFATTKKKELKKRGLHFVDNSEDLRTAYIRLLSEFPLRAYIACGHTGGDPKSCYMRLLEQLLRDRLARHWAARISISIEKGDHPSQQEAETLCAAVVAKLRRGIRGPLFAPSVAVLKKTDEIGLSATDYTLAAFRAYAIQSEPGVLASTRFERLRDKIRLVHDVDGRVRYWRKKPLKPGAFAPATGQQGDPGATAGEQGEETDGEALA